MVDMRALQTKKQHHVHAINATTQMREPLTSCRREDNVAICEADLPHTAWLVEEPVVLCAGTVVDLPLSQRLLLRRSWVVHDPLISRQPSMQRAKALVKEVALEVEGMIPY